MVSTGTQAPGPLASYAARDDCLTRVRNVRAEEQCTAGMARVLPLAISVTSTMALLLDVA